MNKSKSQYEAATMRTIARGEVIDKVDHELAQVFKNCADPNTDPTATREVRLVIKIKPGNDRERAQILYQASSKLAPDAQGSDQLYLATTEDGPAGFVHTPDQLTLDDFIEGEPVAGGLTALRGGEQC